MITAPELRELLAYDPATGIFTWRVRKAICVTVGQVAGRAMPAGYVQIKIGYRAYLAHRLVWLYVHGKWPENEVDHINGIPGDNRIANLRDVTTSVNQLNRHRANPNKLGFPGIYLKRGRFGARVMVDGRFRYLGVYDTAAEAHEVYQEARSQWHAQNAMFTVLEVIQAGARA